MFTDFFGWKAHRTISQAGKSATTTVLTASLILGMMVQPPASAQTTLRLAIQPIQSEQRTKEAFQPMADYIHAVTGTPCEITTFPNFISYWSTTQKPGSYDLVLDAAHFTDYRIVNQDFTPIVKQPGEVSFSLIVGEDSLVFDAEELVGKKIATLGAPSIGAVRLGEIFDNPVRQPLIIEVDNSTSALDMLIAGEVDAAMLPTPIVSQRMSGEGGVNVVMTTESMPSVALSVSPDVPEELRNKLQEVFLNADKTEAGRAMLSAVNLPSFEKAGFDIYENMGELLEDF
jgi:ABC-type phosphate/phosphonate transport system substrate-binding protein